MQFTTLERLNENLKCVSLPVEAMFDYDLEHLSSNLRSNFDFQAILDAQVDTSKVLDLDPLNSLSKSLKVFGVGSELLTTIREIKAYSKKAEFEIGDATRNEALD